jgi:hypothetical protein
VFALQDVQVSFTDTNKRDPIYQAQGTLLKNGAAIGGFFADRNTGQVGVELTGGEIVEL